MEQEPGTWENGSNGLGVGTREILSGELQEARRKSFIEAAKPQFSQELNGVYEFFQARFGVPRRVFYPCSHIDATPTIAFPNSEVVLLDKDEDAIEILRRNGLGAIVGDVRRYKPEDKFDLLILLNPGIRSKDATHTLRTGGYIIANEYHGNTTQLLERGRRYAFEGTVHHGKKPHQLLSVEQSRRLLEVTDPFFNLYSIFRKRF